MRRTNYSKIIRKSFRMLGLSSAFCVVVATAVSMISTHAAAREAEPLSVGAKAPAVSRVMAVINEIAQTVTDTEYRHQTRVRQQRGQYYFDCSGMAEWILKRSAPSALKSVGSPEGGRPLARNFFKAIARITPGEKRGGWQRLARVEDAGPGDVLAWIRPKWFPSKSTGHVAFILDKPRRNTGPVDGWLVRIADASKFQHENDTRGQNETGFGMGTLLVPIDAAGNPVGYGWVGSLTPEEWIVPTELVIGRPLR